jgi:CubicO group peptidase (beta-lactamase class C family)
MTTPHDLDALLDQAEDVVAPSISALVLDVGDDGLATVCYARATDRVYDLASLTKVLCTTEVTLRAVHAGRLALDTGHPALPRGVTVRHLLQHASGWPAHRRYHDWLEGAPDARATLVREVLAEPLEAPPGARHVYSDLGFLALGNVLETVLGARIDALFAQAWPDSGFTWGHPASQRTDGTDGGPVNDGNCRAMGGVASHAGLYGTAQQVGEAGRRWLAGRVPLARDAFTQRGPGTHALGWDTANPDGTSTAGPNPPPDAVGHTGYTGTSIWMSPSRRRVAALLTNRVAYTLDVAPVRGLRQAFHQAAWELPV